MGHFKLTAFAYFRGYGNQLVGALEALTKKAEEFDGLVCRTRAVSTTLPRIITLPLSETKCVQISLSASLI